MAIREEIKIGGCGYVYIRENNTHRLYYDSNDKGWREDLKGKLATQIEEQKELRRKLFTLIKSLEQEEPKQETVELVKDLAYWKKNAEEDYLKVPISVLRYITELEKTMYSKKDMEDSFVACWKANVPEGIECKLSFKEWFEQFNKK